jgi:hypothetical protein
MSRLTIDEYRAPKTQRAITPLSGPSITGCGAIERADQRAPRQRHENAARTLRKGR